MNSVENVELILFWPKVKIRIKVCTPQLFVDLMHSCELSRVSFSEVEDKSCLNDGGWGGCVPLFNLFLFGLDLLGFESKLRR